MGLPEAAVTLARKAVHHTLGLSSPPGTPGLQPLLFKSLAERGDPDHYLKKCLTEGASSGILHPVKSAGVFPAVQTSQASEEELNGLVSVS
jgi:hypothetical protein